MDPEPLAVVILMTSSACASPDKSALKLGAFVIPSSWMIATISAAVPLQSLMMTRLLLPPPGVLFRCLGVLRAAGAGEGAAAGSEVSRCVELTSESGLQSRSANCQGC